MSSCKHATDPIFYLSERKSVPWNLSWKMNVATFKKLPFTFIYEIVCLIVSSLAPVTLDSLSEYNITYSAYCLLINYSFLASFITAPSTFIMYNFFI